MFQKPILLDWRTVLGNVMMQIELRGLKVADHLARARQLLDAVGLADFEDRSPTSSRAACSSARRSCAR